MVDMKSNLQPDAAEIQRAADFDAEGHDRRFKPHLQYILSTASALYALFHLTVLNYWPLDEWMFRVLHVNLGAVLAFITLRAFASGPDNRTNPVDWILAAAALGCTAYVGINLDGLLMRTGVVTTTGDFICGVAGTLVVAEFARRTSGVILPLIALAFVSYLFVGPWLPGVLHHAGFETGNAFSFLYSQDAIFGQTTAASSRYIIIFVAFAVFLQASGVGDYFMQIAMALFGSTRGGPGKVAVVSSLLFGTISGSAVANVVASGTFTIPLMRRRGYSSDDAGAIEATASSGGQLVPPVMGAGAFIMAEITGIPYFEICVAAALPALLFYASVYLCVDKHAQRNELHGVPRAELPKLKDLARDVLLLLPLFTLLYLLFTGYSIIAAGTWGLASTLLVMLVNGLGLPSLVLALPLALYVLAPLSGYPINVAGAGASLASSVLILALGALSGRARKIDPTISTILSASFIGLADTTRKSLQLISVMACAGIVVGVLGLTGLSGRFSAVLLAIAGNSEILAFALGMVIAIILGMGMPTTAAYAIAASVVAPALQQMGISPLAAHMFVFYCAVISAITPPVAIAAFAASTLAGGSPWGTAFKAIRFGMAAFLLPYMFYATPQILMTGAWIDALRIFAIALFALYLLAAASEAFLFGGLGFVERGAALAAGALLLWTGLVSDLAGLALAGGLLAWRFSQRPKRALSLQAGNAG